VVNGLLQNDGFVSATGAKERTSGGSIYITANNLAGIGTYTADGRNTAWPNGSVELWITFVDKSP